MKQAITQEQFEELTPAQRMAYITWVMEKIKQTGNHAEVYRSIGHLIWFLDEHKDGNCNWWGMQQASEGGWYLEGDHGTAEGKELIDALWEAVKMTLSQQEEEST